MKKYRLFSILVAVFLVVALVLSTSLLVSAQTPTPTDEPTEEPTEEPTAEPTDEPTEEPTAEPTDEPTEEPTAEPTDEPTEEPTVEPTEEPTVEPTATVAPTAEITATATVTPTVGAAGDVTAQQTYGGSWTSYVAVQNIGTGLTDIAVDWYLSGADSVCGSSAYTDLQPGRATRFTPPGGSCGSSWVGSAVVSGAEPLAAMAETLGNQGLLLSGYMGSSDPTTDALIIPFLNNSSWHSLVGISNAGTATANVRVSLMPEAGGPAFDSKDVSIPAQSATHVNINTDFNTAYWRGSVKIENIGTPQPLYAAVKAERYLTEMPYPVTVSYESIRETAASTNWMFPVVHKRTTNGTIPDGQNQTLAFVNPDDTNSTTVTIHWLNRDGSEITPVTTVNLNPNGTGYVTTRDTPQLGVGWSGLVKAETTAGRPVIALGQPWVASGGYYNYSGWAGYNPLDISGSAGSNVAYVPAVHKQSSGGGRSGNGWCTSVMVNNLDETSTTRVQIEIYDETTGAQVYYQERDIDPNGQVYWYTLASEFDSSMGSDFFGAAKVTVMSGGPIIAIAQGSLSSYGTSSGYSFYNGINQ
jgi:hypothetical protein